MEVHQHSHTSRQKWTHYLWEFLMLFFAVFCGFLAENLREHQVEYKREKQYIESMLEDLKSDTTTYSNYAKKNAEIYTMIDSLIRLMKSDKRKTQLNKIYFLARMITLKLLIHFSNKSTYEQMKSSGQLRLIGNRQSADSIHSYYNSLEIMNSFNDVLLEHDYDYMRLMGKVFDAETLLNILKERKEPTLESTKLLTEDPVVINELLTSAQYIYGSLQLAQNITTQRQHSAENLIAIIKKEYNLK
jgi:hypothetical protein